MVASQAGDATVRFVREAGWANAMCYMLIGEHWSAEEAFRMGVAQNIAPTPDQAMQTEIEAAMRIAACGPLGIKATLASAHLAIESSEGEALSKLEAQYRALYRTEDFKEVAKRRRKAVHRFIRESDLRVGRWERVILRRVGTTWSLGAIDENL